MYDGSTSTTDVELSAGVAVTLTAGNGAKITYQTKLDDLTKEQEVVKAADATKTSAVYVLTGTTVYVYGTPAKTADITGSDALVDTGTTDGNAVVFRCLLDDDDVDFAQDQT